jgi:SAM-dependent methyltransferase
VRRSAESVFWDLQSRTWDERFADPAIGDHVADLATWLASALAAGAGGAAAGEPVVADLGCGTGAHAAALRTMGVATVAGLERSPGMAGRAAAQGVPVVRCDVAAGLPLATSSLDGALTVYCLQFLDVRPVLVEVARVLRPGAPFVVEVPRTDGGRRPSPAAGWSWRFRVAQRLNRTAAFVGSRIGVVRTLTSDELDGFLVDAGFEVVEHRDTARSVAAHERLRARGAAAERPAGRRRPS